MKSPTPSQSAALAARGNVLLEAGAGAGKTSTLVARCVAELCAEFNPVSLDELLMVTFTEAAAAEMRRRIREALTDRAAREPANQRLAEQLALLDQARIGTLHSFCFRLVRDHFHELGLDPQSQVLDEGEARLLAAETVRELLDEHFNQAAAESNPVLELIRLHGGGSDQPIQEVVISLHHHLQTLPDPAGWLAREIQAWAQFDLPAWEALLKDELNAALPGWREQLQSQPTENEVAHRCAGWLAGLPAAPTRDALTSVLRQVAGQRADEFWPRGTKGKFRDPILSVLEEAAVLTSFAAPEGATGDPLAEDFALARPHVLALLELVREFGERFTARKRQRAGLDFSDLEQLSLRLLWDHTANQPTPIAREWRDRLRVVFVDEYQDINEAQDRIIAAISREGAAANRFLVGDVKQSIYGFRLARPDIFLRYARAWRHAPDDGQVLPLADNFRSHEAILAFVNRCFASLLREEVGGIGYPPEAYLQFGDPAGRSALSRTTDPQPRVELCLRLIAGNRSTEDPDDSANAAAEEELTNAETEARIAAARLRELKSAGTPVFDRATQSLRPVEWRDMAILLRATAGKAEIYARTFARAGIPLAADRRGFFEAIEISDLVSLLLLLDNPRQDIPLLAVLRSPLVGLNADELVAVRLAAPEARSFWVALNRFHEVDTSTAAPAAQKVSRFLLAFHRWRDRARRGSLSQCLEDLLDETHYAAWLAAQPRGDEQLRNVQRLLELTRHYDSWQGRGLHRFLEYVRLIDEDGAGPEPATATGRDAVRLMTIHASKGLEFPIVLLADLNKPFRQDAPTAGFLVDDELGLCPMIKDPGGRKEYPSLRMLRAQRRQRQRLLAEEIRLLYVAMTRACDRLILLGTARQSRAEQRWTSADGDAPVRPDLNSARSPLDLLGPLLPDLCQRGDWLEVADGASELLNWRLLTGDEAPPAGESVEAAASAPAPQAAPVDLDALSERLQFRYPFLEATRQAGKTTVTRVRRQIAELAETEATELFRAPSGPRAARKTTGLSAAQVGIAHHTFFQNVSFDAVDDPAGLAGEAERLVAGGRLSPEEARSLELDRVLRFWSGEVGREIRARSAQVQRELAFTLALPVSELEALLRSGQPAGPAARADSDRVIVQGIVDLAVIGPEEIWILDYKTDQVTADGVADRARAYQPQVELYRRALERIYRRPVTRVWLHFLQPGISLAMRSTQGER